MITLFKFWSDSLFRDFFSAISCRLAAYLGNSPPNRPSVLNAYCPLWDGWLSHLQSETVLLVVQARGAFYCCWAPYRRPQWVCLPGCLPKWQSAARPDHGCLDSYPLWLRVAGCQSQPNPHEGNTDGKAAGTTTSRFWDLLQVSSLLSIPVFKGPFSGEQHYITSNWHMFRKGGFFFCAYSFSYIHFLY